MMTFSTVGGNPDKEAAGQRISLIQRFRKHSPEQQGQGGVVHTTGCRQMIGSLKGKDGITCAIINGCVIIRWGQIPLLNQSVLNKFNRDSLVSKLNEASTLCLIALAGDFSKCDGR